MQTSLLSRFILIVLIVTAPHVMIASSRAQTDVARKFSRVPGRFRARLIERFNLFIGYEHSRDCDNLYDMMAPDILEFRRSQGADRADYVENCKKGFEFQGKVGPFETRVLSVHSTRRGEGVEAAYRIKVIEKFRRNGRTVEEDSEVWAKLIMGEWYFDHPDVQY